MESMALVHYVPSSFKVSLVDLSAYVQSPPVILRVAPVTQLSPSGRYIAGSSSQGSPFKPAAVVTTPGTQPFTGGRCINVKEVPKMLSLDNLTELNLSGTSITSLPAEIARLPRLQRLALSSCEHLEMLPAEWEDGEDLFPRLEEVSLAKSGVRKLARGITAAPELKKIDVTGCNQELYEPELLSVLENRKLVHILGWPIMRN